MNERPIALRYLRVSGDEQGNEGLSLGNQDRRTLAYSLEHQFLPGPLFQDVMTGKRDDRADYQKLLAEARRLRAAGQPVVVVLFRLNRFGRRLIERARAYEELTTKLDVKIHSVTEGGVLSELVQNILAAVAQEEVRQLSENIASTLQGAKAQGWWPGGALPYGYRWRPRTEDQKARGAPKQVLDREPAQADYVAEGYRQLAAGASANSVQRWLVNLSEDERGGRVMHIRSVRLMFQSPMYKGWSAEGVRGQWPALVDVDIWEKAQQAFRPRGATGREASIRYLLTGFLFCPECGRSMAGMRSPAKGRAHAQTRYRCSSGVYGERCRFGVNTEVTENAVREKVAAVLDAYNDPDQRCRIDAAWTLEQSPRVVSNVERTRRQLEKDIERADQEIAGAVRLLASERIDQDAYDALYRDAAAKRDAARKKLTAAEPAVAAQKVPELPPLDEMLGTSPSWSAALARGDDVEAQRRVLSLFVARVIPQRVGWGKVAVAVDWTPLGKRLMMPAPVAGEQVS